MVEAVDYAAMRHAMVASQLRPSGVDDARVVAAMARVPRERFLPEPLRVLAYRDAGVALGAGRGLNAPVATGRLLTEAGVRPTDRVLLIGAAMGYTAAVLAELAAVVVAVEQDAALMSLARSVLGDRPEITLVEGPLTDGAAEAAPFDLLLVDGAVEAIPDALLAQRRPGGRSATGLVDRGVTRLATGTRSAGGAGLQAFADMDCARLPGFDRPRAFSF